MAEQTLSIRLFVLDGGKVKATLSDVGESGSRALKRIEDAARPASRSLQALNAVTGELRGSAEAMAGRLGPLGSALARIHPAALLAAAGPSPPARLFATRSPGRTTSLAEAASQSSCQ